jgi:hypothetical protein
MVYRKAVLFFIRASSYCEGKIALAVYFMNKGSRIFYPGVNGGVGDLISNKSVNL